jgi:hypothetical protein
VTHHDGGDVDVEDIRASEEKGLGQRCIRNGRTSVWWASWLRSDACVRKSGIQSVGTRSTGSCTKVLAPDSTSHAQGVEPRPSSPSPPWRKRVWVVVSGAARHRSALLRPAPITCSPAPIHTAEFCCWARVNISYGSPTVGEDQTLGWSGLGLGGSLSPASRRSCTWRRPGTRCRRRGAVG